MAFTVPHAASFCSLVVQVVARDVTLKRRSRLVYHTVVIKRCAFASAMSTPMHACMRLKELWPLLCTLQQLSLLSSGPSGAKQHVGEGGCRLQ